MLSILFRSKTKNLRSRRFYCVGIISKNLQSCQGSGGFFIDGILFPGNAICKKFFNRYAEYVDVMNTHLLCEDGVVAAMCDRKELIVHFTIYSRPEVLRFAPVGPCVIE